MEDKKILLDNIDKIHTTEMGIDRIKRNQGCRENLAESKLRECLDP